MLTTQTAGATASGTQKGAPQVLPVIAGVAPAAVLVKVPVPPVSLLFNRGRPDVITTTSWLAPVVWEGTFSRKMLEKHYRRQNFTTGLAVFATGR